MVHSLALAPFAYLGANNDLLVIFGFVIVLVAMKRVARYHRDKLWHETARQAIEKGQPLPPPPACYPRRGYYGLGPRYGLLGRGIVLLAVSGGLYLALGPDARVWAVLPLLIGIAYILISLVCRGDGPSSGDPQA